MLCRARSFATIAAFACLTASAYPHTAVAQAEFYKQTMHFAVLIGPGDDVACDIVADLYTPVAADAGNKVPAIVTTSGFAQSKEELVRPATLLARDGYAVLAYSGLGFGGSSCKATMDSPDYDGKAASQLISFLGGREGIAFTGADHLIPVPAPDYIVTDATDRDGIAREHDPRVGMIGNSYGGQVQFAVASIDSRVDTIVPAVTWNDLSYSLAPNDIDSGAGVTSAVPGAGKLLWVLGLTAIGAANPGVAGYAADPERAVPCPNLTPELCATVATGLPRGYPDPGQIAFMRAHSVASYVDRIKIPVLLMQGENDTLFNLNEARATYDALQSQGTEVKMIWHSWGHSLTEPAIGELYGGDPNERYQARRILDWFDHYLRDSTVSTGPEFAYFRDWVPYSGNAGAAYASAPTVDPGLPTDLFLAGTGLTQQPLALAPPQTFLTGPAGLPTATHALDPRPTIAIPEASIPGTFARWTGAPQTAPLDVVGSPRLSFTLATERPTNGSLEDAVVVFAKLYDVGPDGYAELINNLVAPMRIVNPAAPVHVTLPAIVHRFDTGHSVRLEIAGGDLNYRGGLVPHVVTVPSGSSQVLTLPVVTP
ncbi:prolyl oligopeptidase family serine peptidase [Antrihabitans sp. YC2-6]|nr:prolyl oligopeptidase family serine peptidase [Antrihabitans sp. YC2-6]